MDTTSFSRSQARWRLGLLLLGPLVLALAAALVVASPKSAAPTQPDPPAAGPRAATDSQAGHVPSRPVDLTRLRFSTSGWKTDFNKHLVPLDEFRGGGPGKDGIPPLDRPKLVSVSEADTWLKPQEPVVRLALNGDTRAYPLQILTWHEIVNDGVGGVPVAVTFCPLCNTAIAFDRRIDGRTLDFGTTGNLRHSDLVMWDRQTESWWQQATGEAIVGELAGIRLAMLPATIISWGEFRQHSPGGRVLSRDTGYSRDYGRNPYVGYDNVDRPPFLFDGKIDGRLKPMERVVVVRLNGEDAAYPFSVLRERRVVADHVGGQEIVVFFQPGTASALDGASIANSRDVGATGVFRPEVRGRRLTFRAAEDGFVDSETGSRWNVLGEATGGPLAGAALEPILHMDPFWFATAAFLPNVRIYRP